VALAIVGGASALVSVKVASPAPAPLIAPRITVAVSTEAFQRSVQWRGLSTSWLASLWRCSRSACWRP
jgi:hypothetical protein